MPKQKLYGTYREEFFAGWYVYIYTIRKPASSTHDSARFAHEGSEAYEGCGETERQLRGARTYHGSGCRYEAVIKEQKQTYSEL
jgi:hypothetical protein